MSKQEAIDNIYSQAWSECHENPAGLLEMYPEDLKKYLEFAYERGQEDNE